MKIIFRQKQRTNFPEISLLGLSQHKNGGKRFSLVENRILQFSRDFIVDEAKKVSHLLKR